MFGREAARVEEEHKWICLSCLIQWATAGGGQQREECLMGIWVPRLLAKTTRNWPTRYRKLTLIPHFFNWRGICGQINSHTWTRKEIRFTFTFYCTVVAFTECPSVFAPHRINASTRRVRVRDRLRVSVWVRIWVRDRVRFRVGDSVYTVWCKNQGDQCFLNLQGFTCRSYVVSALELSSHVFNHQQHVVPSKVTTACNYN